MKKLVKSKLFKNLQNNLLKAKTKKDIKKITNKIRWI